MFLSGCAHKNISKMSLSSRKNYTLVVDGVECAQCAKKAVISLEAVPNVLHAEYVCSDHGYSDCYARVYAKSMRKNLSIAALRKALAKIDFGIASIQGRFSGRFGQDHPIVVIQGESYPIKISHELFNKYKGRKKTFIGRLIIKNNNTWFEI